MKKVSVPDWAELNPVQSQLVEQYWTILDITLQYWTTLYNIKDNWTILGYAMEYHAILGRIIQYLNDPNNLSNRSNS